MKESSRYEEAFEAYNRGDNETALQVLSAFANAGDVYARTFIAAIIGEDSEDDPARQQQAVSLYEGAAVAGCPHAAAALGAYYVGREDFTEARRWNLLAADGGDVDAQAVLGDLWSDGKGGPQSYEEATYWYAQAAETGHYGAQGALGMLYARGLGIEQDLTFALFWLLVASAQGTEDVRMRRDYLASMLMPDQVNRAQRAALNWEPRRH